MFDWKQSRVTIRADDGGPEFGITQVIITLQKVQYLPELAEQLCFSKNHLSSNNRNDVSNIINGLHRVVTDEHILLRMDQADTAQAELMNHPPAFGRQRSGMLLKLGFH